MSHIHGFVNYRYENGILNPDMGSVFIALDPSVKANGCLQVFSFYHHMCSDSHISLGGITSNTRHIPASYSSVPTFPNNIYRHICYCLSSVKRFYSINSVNSVNSAVWVLGKQCKQFEQCQQCKQCKHREQCTSYLFISRCYLQFILFFRYIDPIFDDDADINKDKYKEWKKIMQ